MGTKTNLLAAKIVGHEVEVARGMVNVGTDKHIWQSKFCGKLGYNHRPFDIFADTPQGAVDSKEVVIALGVKHGIFFNAALTPDCTELSSLWEANTLGPMGSEDEFLGVFKTYPEAMAAAVESVRSEYEY